MTDNPAPSQPLGVLGRISAVISDYKVALGLLTPLAGLTAAGVHSQLIRLKTLRFVAWLVEATGWPGLVICAISGVLSVMTEIGFVSMARTASWRALAVRWTFVSIFAICGIGVNPRLALHLGVLGWTIGRKITRRLQKQFALIDVKRTHHRYVLGFFVALAGDDAKDQDRLVNTGEDLMNSSHADLGEAARKLSLISMALTVTLLGLGSLSKVAAKVENRVANEIKNLETPPVISPQPIVPPARTGDPTPTAVTDVKNLNDCEWAGFAKVVRVALIANNYPGLTAEQAQALLLPGALKADSLVQQAGYDVAGCAESFRVVAGVIDYVSTVEKQNHERQQSHVLVPLTLWASSEEQAVIVLPDHSSAFLSVVGTQELITDVILVRGHPKGSSILFVIGGSKCYLAAGRSESFIDDSDCPAALFELAKRNSVLTSVIKLDNGPLKIEFYSPEHNTGGSFTLDPSVRKYTAKTVQKYRKNAAGFDRRSAWFPPVETPTPTTNVAPPASLNAAGVTPKP